MNLHFYLRQQNIPEKDRVKGAVKPRKAVEEVQKQHISGVNRMLYSMFFTNKEPNLPSIYTVLHFPDGFPNSQLQTALSVHFLSA